MLHVTDVHIPEETDKLNHEDAILDWNDWEIDVLNDGPNFVIGCKNGKKDICGFCDGCLEVTSFKNI